MSGARRSLPILGRLNEASIAEAVHRTLSESMLARSFSADAVGADAFSLFEQALAQVEARIPPSRERACSSGCAYCCHLKVAVTPLEVLRLAAALRGRLDTATLSTLADRVRELDDRTHGMTLAARAVAKIPCPLLGEGARCVAYDARPMACAGANSFEVEQCKRGFEGEEAATIEHYGLQPRVAGAARTGAAGAVAERGLDGRTLELVAALRIALDDPNAEDRWKRGEPVFEAAVDAEASGS